MMSPKKKNMSTSPKMAREKLSTTVSAETYQFLQEMVDRGDVATLAEALDVIVEKIRRLENRRRLAEATTRYFEQLGPQAVKDEQELAEDFSSAFGVIDFDREN